MPTLAGKVVIITGAAGGLGRAMAKKFAEAGSKLSLCDIDRVGLEKTVQEIKRSSVGVEVFSKTIDLRDLSQIECFAEETITKYGRADVLINNAGLLLLKVISDVSEADYGRLMDVNVKAIFFLTKKLLPELVKTKGSVINMSSISSISCSEELIVYSMTKTAVNMFTKCVAKEYAAQGVRVNSISPGASNTNILGSGENPTFLRLLAPIVQPLAGIIEPEAIARWAIFLASSDSGPITGQNVVVDSGFLVTQGAPAGYKLTKI